jgi:hypothetical protein
MSKSRAPRWADHQQRRSEAKRADVVESWKGIAAYVSEKTGCNFTEAAVRMRARRGQDPLPAGFRCDRVVAVVADLDAWIARRSTV